jgi:hypothetical protein
MAMYAEKELSEHLHLHLEFNWYIFPFLVASIMAAASEPAIPSSNDTHRVERYPQSKPGVQSYFFSSHLDEDVRNHHYPGKATIADPYVTDYPVRAETCLCDFIYGIHSVQRGGSGIT